MPIYPKVHLPMGNTVSLNTGVRIERGTGRGACPRLADGSEAAVKLCRFEGHGCDTLPRAALSWTSILDACSIGPKLETLLHRERIMDAIWICIVVSASGFGDPAVLHGLRSALVDGSETLAPVVVLPCVSVICR
jgi:hypothetical protein